MITNQVLYRFNPGDLVWGLHCYPSGARIWSGRITDIFIRIRKDGASISYALDTLPKLPVPVRYVYATEEEAQAARSAWIAKPEVQARRKENSQAN